MQQGCCRSAATNHSMVHCRNPTGQLQTHTYTTGTALSSRQAQLSDGSCSGNCPDCHPSTHSTGHHNCLCDVGSSGAHEPGGVDSSDTCAGRRQHSQQHRVSSHLGTQAAATSKQSQCFQIAATSCCSSRCSCEDLHVQVQHDHPQVATVAGNVSSALRLGASGTVITRIHAAGICCPMESRLIHSILDNIPGVLAVDVTVVTKAVTVGHEPTAISPAALVAALNSSGLQATLNTRGVTSELSTAANQQQPGLLGCMMRLQQHPSLPPLTMLASGVLLLVNLLFLIPALPAAAVVKTGLLALCAAVIGIPPVLRKAWAGIKNRNLDMNCLVVVALLGAVGLGEWYEAGALVFLFTLAEWLEERCVSRAARALEDILKLQPETALVVVEAAQHQRQQQPTKASGEDTAAQQEQQQAVESRQHQHGSEHCCQPHAEQKVQCTDAPVDHHAHRHGAGCCEKAHAHKHQASSSNSHCCAAADAAGGTCRVLSGTCCSAAANSRDIHSCTAKACGCDHDHIHQQPQQHHNHYHHHGHNHDHSHIQHHHQQEQEQRPQLLPMPVAQLQAGTLVLVRPGDKVPVDGVIEHGSSVLDESMVTGESKPVSKSVSDTVLAGTVNSGSVALKVRATAAAGDSTVARLAALMEVAAASKSKHDMAVERFAKYYTPLVVLVALLTVVVGSAVQPVHWREWAYLSLVVLVTGCPCALVISTPVASVAGLTRAARRGVLIKGGRYLELLGTLSAVSFDKSGTLTEGHFQLTQLHTFANHTEQQALQLAAALEQHSNHPIAHAIVGAAAARGCMSTAAGAVEVSHIQEIAGKGVIGQVWGQRIAICSWAYAQELQQQQGQQDSQQTVDKSDICVDLESEEVDGYGFVAHAVRSAGKQLKAGETTAAAPGAERQQQQQGVDELMAAATASGATAVCLVVDQQVAAVLLLSDKPRKDASQALQELQGLGVRCIMLTGDNMGAAAHIAGQLGMDVQDVYAQLLPQDKLELLGTMRQRMTQQQAQGQQQCCGLRAMLCQWLGISRSSGDAVDKQEASMPGSSSNKGVRIAHIGDGVNDAPALAAADVGVAMGVAGAALAVDAADVALFSNNLTCLPFAVRLGRTATWIVAANTAFACGIKVAVLACAAAGVASLWMSLLADVGSSLLVTLHALSLLRFEAHSDRDSSSEEGSPSPPSLSVSGNGYGELLRKSNTSTRASCCPDADRLCSRQGSKCEHAANSSSSSWWRQLLMLLSGSASFMSYHKLGHESAAASAAVSRCQSFICCGPAEHVHAHGSEQLSVELGDQQQTQQLLSPHVVDHHHQYQHSHHHHQQQQQQQHGCSGGCCSHH